MFSAIPKKVLKNFTAKIENVNSVILKENQNVTTRIKKNYQINEKYIMKKKRCITFKVKIKPTKIKI